MLITIIIFLVVLSLLVFVHELGHFLTARKFGAKVDEFGFGLPPRIFGLKKIAGRWQWLWGGKSNISDPETIYSLNWIPIGGFVRIKGENGEDNQNSDSFAHKSIWQRAIILAAGVLMNVILCIILLAVGFTVGIPAAVDNLGRGAILSDGHLQIVEVLDTLPAKDAGILPGDVVLMVNDQAVTTIEALHKFFNNQKDQSVTVQIKRGGEQLEKTVLVRAYQDTVGIGIGLAETATVRYPWYWALWQGVRTTAIWLVAILSAFFFLLKDFLTGQPVQEAIAGPVGIAVITGQMVRLGFIYVLQFTAMLSLNLAIINVLPFPALDGGRLLFLVIEKIRGRAVKQQLENLLHNIGFALLMLLVIVVTYQDLLRYGGKLWRAVWRVVGL